MARIPKYGQLSLNQGTCGLALRYKMLHVCMPFPGSMPKVDAYTCQLHVSTMANNKIQEWVRIKKTTALKVPTLVALGCEPVPTKTKSSRLPLVFQQGFDETLQCNLGKVEQRKKHLFEAHNWRCRKMIVHDNHTPNSSQSEGWGPISPFLSHQSSQ